VKEPQKPLPEPFTRAKMLVETEEKRHEHRLRAIAERFELMLSRLDEMQRANDEHYVARLRIIEEAQSGALKAQKSAPPPRPASFTDMPAPAWASRGTAKPKKKR